MTLLAQISVRIIKEQELIIGPIAWDEAKKVSGFQIVDQAKGEVALTGDPKAILNELVARYAKLFGRASDEVCKEAAQGLIAELPPEEVPESLT